jgi:hypothetical protein
MNLLQLCFSPCYQTFWYIIASFWRSLALNPSFWPIFAFGSCNINRHLDFSFRLTVHAKLHETSKFYISYVLLSCKCKNKAHTNNLCALCGIVECNSWNLRKELRSDKETKLLYSPWNTVVLLNWQALLTVWYKHCVLCGLYNVPDMFQTVWFNISGCLVFVLVFFEEMLQEPEWKA